MRKIITLCSLLLALMFVVTMFTACGGKTEDESTTATTTEIAIIDSDSFSAVIAEENAIIKKGSDNFQTLSYPLSFENNFDIEYAKNHYEFIDMNFDGKPDFYIAIPNIARTELKSPYVRLRIANTMYATTNHERK